MRTNCHAPKLISKNDGGNIAAVTRKNIEIKTRKPVVTSKNAIDFQNDNRKVETK